MLQRGKLNVDNAQTVKFSWPDPVLSPNGRSHWAKKAKAAKRYRRDCFMLAKLESLEASWDGPIAVNLKFCPPDARSRDMDNCLASVKNALDGLADALACNDRRFQISASWGDPERLGAVLVSIWEP